MGEAEILYDFDAIGAIYRFGNEIERLVRKAATERAVAEGRSLVTVDDVRAVAPYAIGAWAEAVTFSEPRP